MTNALSAAKLSAEAVGSAPQTQNAAIRNTASSLFFNEITPLIMPPSTVQMACTADNKINFILAKVQQ